MSEQGPSPGQVPVPAGAGAAVNRFPLSRRRHPLHQPDRRCRSSRFFLRLTWQRGAEVRNPVFDPGTADHPGYRAAIRAGRPQPAGHRRRARRPARARSRPFRRLDPEHPPAASGPELTAHHRCPGRQRVFVVRGREDADQYRRPGLLHPPARRPASRAAGHPAPDQPKHGQAGHRPGAAARRGRERFQRNHPGSDSGRSFSPSSSRVSISAAPPGSACSIRGTAGSRAVRGWPRHPTRSNWANACARQSRPVPGRVSSPSGAMASSVRRLIDHSRIFNFYLVVNRRRDDYMAHSAETVERVASRSPSLPC